MIVTVSITLVSLVTVKEEGTEIASVVPVQRTPVRIARYGRRHLRVRFLIPAAKEGLPNVVVFLSIIHRMHAVPLVLARTASKEVERPIGSPEEMLPHRHHRHQNAKGHEAHRLAVRITHLPTSNSAANPVITTKTAKVLVEGDFRSEDVSQVAVDSVEEDPDEGETGKGTNLVAWVHPKAEILYLLFVGGIRYPPADGLAVHVRMIILTEISASGPRLSTQHGLWIQDILAVNPQVIWQ